MAKNKFTRSDMGRITADRIVVRGMGLVNEVIGKVSLGDMARIQITRALPPP